MNSWNEYKNMTKEELEQLKNECERLFPINKKLACGFAIGTVITGALSLWFANNANNNMLVKGDVEAFEKTQETMKGMFHKPDFDVHLD